jgi:hypothetical protein
VKPAIPFHLTFHPVEQIALELLYASAPQAGHVHMVALRTALIEVPISLNVQQIKLIDQSLSFEQIQGPVDGDSVDIGIDLGRLAQNLRGVQMLTGSLNDLQDNPTLLGKPYATGQ